MTLAPVRLSLRLCLLVALGLLGACATRPPPAPANPAAPTVHYDMDEMHIEATPGPAGVQIESFDAEELFEQAGAALSASKYDDAVRFYDKLLSRFPDSQFTRPAIYNRGLALRDKKDWPGAIEAFKNLVERFPTHSDAKDGLFQLGACYAEQTNWPASGEVFVRLLERGDLTADDRVEAMARRGFAQFNLGDLDAAEKTFRGTLAYQQRIETIERLSTDFYLAFAQYHLGEITHQRFRAVSLRLPESQMERDLDQKASLLLQAQRAYIDTMKYGNAAWAPAAGFQVGSLYEELYDAFMHAPVPGELAADARQVYVEELHKKIRILLEKSVRWYRENLRMIERLGGNTDWAEKSRLAYGKLMKLLDPGARPDDDVGPSPAPSVPPSAPAPPAHDGPSPAKDRPPASDDGTLPRQIL
jgi:tetratricopeptide (TPR) repeat protein